MFGRLLSSTTKSMRSVSRLSSSRRTFNNNRSSNLLQSKQTTITQTQKRSFATSYPDTTSEFTKKLTILEQKGTIPTYRIMDENGDIQNEKEMPNLSQETLTKVYKTMVLLNVMDTILYDVQRQGRISFYMTNYGEEGTHLGSALALEAEDTIYAQYREAGVLLWRGFTLDDVMNQCYSNSKDYGKGRQMPVHYGAKHLNFQTISSPLATQIPQASGAAYAMKLLGLKNQVTVCYFGEGAASEGDFHAALNFAATLECPTIFFCRNNHYAISTPTKEQFRGDGIASRGAGYGMATIRVDGNDFFAVYNATKAARNLAVTQNKPVLIEAMTYRVGHHSTSDDSTRYRKLEEVNVWKTKHGAISRMKAYLEKQKLWNEEKEKELVTQSRKDILAALNKAEKERKPNWEELFTDVFDKIPQNLIEQKEELVKHIAKYPDSYHLEEYESSTKQQ